MRAERVSAGPRRGRWPRKARTAGAAKSAVRAATVEKRGENGKVAPIATIFLPSVRTYMAHLSLKFFHPAIFFVGMAGKKSNF